MHDVVSIAYIDIFLTCKMKNINLMGQTAGKVDRMYT